MNWTLASQVAQTGAWDWCDIGCYVERGKLKVQHNKKGIVADHYPQHYTNFRCELDVNNEHQCKCQCFFPTAPRAAVPAWDGDS